MDLGLLIMFPDKSQRDTCAQIHIHQAWFSKQVPVELPVIGAPSGRFSEAVAE